MSKGTVSQKKVEAALDEYVRPLLATHGGDMEVIRIEDGIVYFRMKGACAGCSAADLTSEDLINKELVEHVPGIHKAVLENWISQGLIDQAKAFLRRKSSGEG
jgi:Fe-S cluster biogenesis protein NfuA